MQCDELYSSVVSYLQCSELEEHVHVSSVIAQQDSGKLKSFSGSSWQRYSSIDNSSSLKELQSVSAAVASKLGSDCEWVASEKVHGANFSFVTDGVGIQYASRTSRLGNDADFFQSRVTMPKYHASVLNAFRIAKEGRLDLSTLVIYGEYFGGYYPGHPAEPGLRKIQSGVAYSPGHHFYAYDVCLDGKEYMDFEDARSLLVAAGFPLVAAPLWRGTLNDMLAIDVEALETTIPDLLGLPPLDRFRIAEGIVIRPVKEVSFGTQQAHRALLKKKSKAFWENTNQHAMATKTASAEGVATGFDHLVVAARGLTNENRLRAVISKDPDLLQENQCHKLAGLFAKDIQEDLQKTHGDELSALGKEVSAVKKTILYLARSYVMEHIQAIRDDVG
jgi:Rnl2 family RNA ligase